MAKLKDLLKGKLTENEINLVPSSFDVVGSILIFSEFPKELSKKEKIVGKTLLESFSHIKTVCKKVGRYQGRYRTPKLKIIAGEKTKETTHKENGILLSLDVEKVYFSTRSANERLRIAKEVKEGEDVLVMFSGCAPFPCVIARNAKPHSVTGVELNPIAHRYALENIKLNRLKNIFLCNGDVKKVLPKLGFEKIGLKSKPDKKNLSSKIKEKPGVIEFFIPEGYLESSSKLKKIHESINYLDIKGIKVMLHAPIHYKGRYLGLAHDIQNSREMNECLFILETIRKAHLSVIGYVIHAAEEKEQTKEYSEEALIYNLNALESSIKNHLFLENNLDPFTFGTKKSILRVTKATGLSNICFDFAHYTAVNGHKILIADLKELKENLNIYYHIANHNPHSTKHSSLLRQGILNFKEIAPLVDFGCIEVYSKDEVKAKEQIEDYRYFLSLKQSKKFDRILMPLPKSAESFLEVALTKAKKGTIIHFYDFLDEKEFYKAEEKAKKACEKAKMNYRVLKLVKCGQFGPRIFRVCLDFQVL